MISSEYVHLDSVPKPHRRDRHELMSNDIGVFGTDDTTFDAASSCGDAGRMKHGLIFKLAVHGIGRSRAADLEA
jgi:hypothetical protein